MCGSEDVGLLGKPVDWATGGTLGSVEAGVELTGGGCIVLPLAGGFTVRFAGITGLHTGSTWEHTFFLGTSTRTPFLIARRVAFGRSASLGTMACLVNLCGLGA